MKSRLKKFVEVVISKKWLKYSLIFLLFFLTIAIVQFSFPDIAGVDGYYHIKHAYLIRTQGFSAITDFNWTTYSVLNDYPSDLWFGFHIFLLPFTFFSNLIFGAKLASAIFASLFLLIFYIILSKFRVKHPLFWSALLLVINSGFFFRLLMPRGAIFSLIFYAIGLYFLFKKKYIYLFFLSWIYALTYPGFIVFLGTILLYVLLELLYKKTFDWKLLAASFLGVLPGLIIRPDFPSNLYMLYVQDILALFYKLKGVNLNFGIEFKEFFNPFLKHNLFLFFLYLSSTISVFLGLCYRKIKENKIFLAVIVNLFILLVFLATLLFTSAPLIANKVGLLVLVVISLSWIVLPGIGFAILVSRQVLLKSKYSFYVFFLLVLVNLFYFLSLIAGRFIEYFIPVIVIFAGMSCHLLFFNKKKKCPHNKPWTTPALAIVIILFFIVSCATNYSRYFSSNSHVNKYASPISYLENNTENGELIFHLSWSDFPTLFYFNHTNTYISGMDPTFMYLKDPNKYWLWTHISYGIKHSEEVVPKHKMVCKINSPKDVYEALKENFPIRYIFVENIHSYQNFVYMLKSSPDLFKESPRKDYFIDTAIFEIL